MKALIDPEFRKILEEDPATALRLEKFTEANKREVRLVLTAVKDINARITGLAEQLLCAYVPT